MQDNFERYTSQEVREAIARGESRTDWPRVHATSEDETERLADEDEAAAVIPSGWHTAREIAGFCGVPMHRLSQLYTRLGRYDARRTLRGPRIYRAGRPLVVALASYGIHATIADTASAEVES